MSHKIYMLALLCSMSLTSCWPATEQNEKKSTGIIKNIKSQNEFIRTIGEGNVVVDFYANWCGPCKRLGPIIEKLIQEFTNIKLVKINIDENTTRTISNQYNIKSIPTLILFRNGRQVKRVTGYKSKNELRSIFRSVF